MSHSIWTCPSLTHFGGGFGGVDGAESSVSTEKSGSGVDGAESSVSADRSSSESDVVARKS